MITFLRNVTAAALLAGLVMTPAGCDEFLEVTNPGSLEGDAIDPERDASLLSLSVYQSFVSDWGNYPLYVAWFTNEARVGDTFPTRNSVGRRDVLDGNTHTNGIWGNIHENIQFARTTVAAIEAGGNTVDLARTWFVSGFSILLMADAFCEGTIAESTLVPRGPMTVNALLDSTIIHLEQAQTVANAAGGEVSAALSMAAQVGIARAHLQAGRKAEASAAAAVVPPDFEFELLHLDDANNRALGNNLWSFSEARISLVVGPEFRAMADAADPRIAYVDMGREAQDGILNFFRQDKYKGWADFERFASGLEARYIKIEADQDPAAMLAFINERRAVGNQTPFASTDINELMSELMEQKTRDFWLEGKRLADWRRNPNFVPYIIPPGDDTYYKDALGPVRDINCWSVPQAEKDNNPAWTG
ncbi:MAG: hypothetical protein ACREL7_11830 [Longimicrobiales bacterium]